MPLQGCSATAVIPCTVLTEGRTGCQVHGLRTSCTLQLPLQRSAVALLAAFAKATTSLSGLVLASVVVMPPWPKGRMFPPRM